MAYLRWSTCLPSGKTSDYAIYHYATPGWKRNEQELAIHFIDMTPIKRHEDMEITRRFNFLEVKQMIKKENFEAIPRYTEASLEQQVAIQTACQKFIQENEHGRR